MIVKIFNQGTSNGKEHIDYLFSEEKHKAFKPQLLKGNRFITEEITASITNKNKYVAGVIAFRENEILEKSQLLDIIESFEATFSPFQDKGRVNFLWVLHKDKGNTELHFISPRLDLKSLKSLDIHPNTKTNLLLYEHFTIATNYKYGFEQVDKKKYFKSNFDFSKKLVLDLVKKRAVYFQSKYCEKKKTIYNKSTTKSKIKGVQNGMGTNRKQDGNALHINARNSTNAITTTRNIVKPIERERERKSITNSKINSSSSKQHIELKGKNENRESKSKDSVSKAQNLIGSSLAFQLQEVLSLYSSEQDIYKRLELYNRLISLRYQIELEENAKKLEQEKSYKLKP